MAEDKDIYCQSGTSEDDSTYLHGGEAKDDATYCHGGTAKDPCIPSAAQWTTTPRNAMVE
jgi:predicted CxxxxCH...CXXCH cytochrome family protein